MKKFILATVIASLLTTSAVFAAETKTTKTATPAVKTEVIAPTIGVVNVSLVSYEYSNTEAFKKKEEAARKEFEPRQQELMKMDGDLRALAQQIRSGTLTGDKLVDAQRKAAQLESDLNLKGRALQEDQQKKLGKLQQEVAGTIQNAINAIAKERGYQLILTNSNFSIAYAVEQIDITQEVIDRVTKSK